MGAEASQMAVHEAAMGASSTCPGGMAPCVAVPVAATTPACGTTQPAAWQQNPPPDPAATTILQEPVLLSQLVNLLGNRPRYSLLLSDLGALLPGQLRHGVKEKGGLRSWLQKYPELFQVSGFPGKESVTLLLGPNTDRAGIQSGGVNVSKLPAKKSGGEADSVKDSGGAVSSGSKKDDDEEDNDSAVQMRGLPYRATVADVKKFLGAHAASLKDEFSIQLVANRDGRPSGFARVQFDSVEAARAARDSLHMQVMELAGGNHSASSTSNGLGAQDRYVEMFLYSERPNKLRIKKLATGGGPSISEEEAVEVCKVSKEQVVLECREHMMTPGKGQLLLSMLGVALSDGARLYLKKTDQGLKQFLAQYPHEFTVDGVKGRECVSYFPALAKGAHNSDLPPSFQESQRKNHRRAGEGTGGPATGSINDLQRFPNEPQRFVRREEPALVPESPKVTESLNVDTPKELGATPSDWGTPQLGAFAFPGFDPLNKAQTSQGGIAGAGRDALGQPHSDGGTSSEGDDNWAAWTMPPPSYWPDPSCWPQQGSGLPFLNAVDGPSLGPAASTAATVGSGMSVMVGPIPAGGLALPRQPAHELPPAVHLRGLPLTANEQDVLAFFAKHDVVDRVSEAPNAVKIIKRSNGTPSGQATVHMMSRTDAHVALRVLNGQYMDSRYVEVSHYTEGTSDAVEKDGTATTGPLTTVGGATTAPGSMPCAAAILQPVGIIPAGPCQWTMRPVEGQGLFDGAGDTGGSGGTGGVGGMVTANFPQHAWWGAAQAAETRSAAATAQGPHASSNAEASAVGTGDGSLPHAEEEQERWEALFNFLKRDGGEPSRAPVAEAGLSVAQVPAPLQAA